MSRTKTGDDSVRETNDRYLTPDKYPRRLFDQVLKPWWLEERDMERAPMVLEPGCGQGVHLHHAQRVWPTAQLHGVDVDSEAYGPNGSYIIRDADFFEEAYRPGAFDLVVTNPPYVHAQEFVDRSLEITDRDGLVVMLLRLNFLGAQSREDWWRYGGGRALANVYTMADRPKFVKGKSDACEYGYFIFEPWRLEETSLDTLPPATTRWLWRTQVERDAYRPRKKK